MKDGGSVYPVYESDTDINGSHSEGMCLRDYFAGQALAGLFKEGDTYIEKDIAERIAEQCFTVADAMLAEREKRK